MRLTAALQDPARKEHIERDCVALIETQVAAKRGVSGIALRAVFKALKAIRPGILGQAVKRLLPEFAPSLEPHVERGCQQGDLEGHFSEHRGAIADALLAVTDQRAERSTQRAMVKCYKSARSAAHKHTMDALPAVAKLIERHIEA